MPGIGHDQELVLLPSAVTRFRCGSIQGKARILLDVCSQPTIAADTIVKKYNLPLEKSNSVIRGVGEGPSSKTHSNSCVNITLFSNSEPWELTMKCDVVPASAIQYSAKFKWPADIFNQVRSFNLADPAMGKIDVDIHDIDIVVGAKYFEKCVCNETRLVNDLTFR